MSVLPQDLLNFHLRLRFFVCFNISISRFFPEFLFCLFSLVFHLEFSVVFSSSFLGYCFVFFVM